MASNNNISSAGIYINEVDQSFLSEGIVSVGAAIVGPTAKGPVESPTVVTSYNEYVAKFGELIESGTLNTQFSFFNNAAAYHYFTNGGNALLVTRVANGTHASSTDVVSGSATNKDSFTLNTIAQGADQNTGTGGETGLMDSGSRNNIKYQIKNSNTGSGTFTLVVRRGDDDDNQQIILEQYFNLTLDPFDDNYIGKRVGTQYTSVEGTGADVYIQTNGDYPNASKYVYVSNISDTPNYADGLGNVRVPAFTGSIPANTATGSDSPSFSGGSGTPLSDHVYGKDITSTNIQGVGASAYTSSFYILNDTKYQYTSLAAPGLNYADHSTQLDILLNNAKNRQDFLAIVDLGGYSASITDVTTEATSLNNSFAASYYPWLLSKDITTGKNTWSPPSTFIPGVFAYNDKVGEPWFAPAGLNRGALPTVIGTQRSLTKANRDTLYDAKVNPITAFPGAGVVVFGQKTLQSKASALDRINVRRLLITVKQFLDSQAGNIVFEQNTISTRNNFLAIVNPYLESVQQRNGLYAFKVIMDESINTPAVIDRNQLVGQFFLQPTRTAEFIILNFNVQPTGASFPDV